MPQHVQALLRAKEREGVLSPTTIGYIRTVLRITLHRALKWNLIERNVAALADAPRKTCKERVPLTPEQAGAFLIAADGDRLEALYLITAAFGLRLGEALGLRWQDVDLDAGTLRIRQTAQRVDGALIFKEPKTEKSRRTLTLPTVLVDALRRHCDRQEFEAAGAKVWRDQGLVFTNTYAGHLNQATCSSGSRRRSPRPAARTTIPRSQALRGHVPTQQRRAHARRHGHPRALPNGHDRRSLRPRHAGRAS
jgi:integrase